MDGFSRTCPCQKLKNTMERSIVGEFSLHKRLPFNVLKEEEQDKGMERVAKGMNTSSPAPLLALKNVQAG